MIDLKKGLTQSIYFTGTETSLPSYPNYNFTFTNRLAEEIVTVNNRVNLSTTGRYQRVSIVVNDFFLNV